MRSFSSRAGSLVLAVAMVTLNGCSDHLNPTAASPALQPQRVLLPGEGGDANFSPTISELALSQSTLVIDGASAAYTATVTDPNDLFDGLSLQGYLIQGSTQRYVGGRSVSCPAGSPSCTVSSTITTSGLVPGAAIFRLQLLDDFGTVVDSKDIAVTLVPNAPRISALSLASDTAIIDGSAVLYTATLANPGPTFSNVGLQAYLNQGSVRHAAGGTSVSCGSSLGVVPTGTCTVLAEYLASNRTINAVGTLVPGAATLELHLRDSNGRDLDTKTVLVTLKNP